MSGEAGYEFSMRCRLRSCCKLLLRTILLEGRVVPVVEAAIGMAAAGLTEYRDAGELLCMFTDLADAVRSRTLN